ncbi:MAG: N-acetyl-gamma-glutamyl-phosphate reductase, partial [Lentisphaeria bacterium]|nr:N-acetyl-gamma-glutamyl-phosphate reductase [Lentisphaeria bacterium]
MTTKVFIDGKAGTTGLRIYDRLLKRSDIELLTLSDEDRKSTEKRQAMLNGCDIAFLCLPDDAAREAVALIDNPEVVVLDTSTAHRTLDDWAYGF